MALDFEKVNEKDVGFIINTYGELERLKFKEVIKEICENHDRGGLEDTTRWMTYERLRKFLQNSEKQDLAYNGKIVNTREVADISLKREAIRNTMELIVDVYLSKGKINNEHLY